MNIDLDKIFKIKTESDFNDLSLQIFRYQATNNIIYKKYLSFLGTDVKKIKTINDIPFLPIDFFKYHKIICNDKIEEKVFKSSGTTLSKRSYHYIVDLQLYETSFYKTFKYFYGKSEKYCIIGLLPSYIETGDSSLVYMTEYLIKMSKHKLSGLYLHDYDKLIRTINILEKKNEKYIIIGVSYALLDFIELLNKNLKQAIIIETGGMKGKRLELPKNELHNILSQKTGIKHIHSEYGMTELLSQAYSKKYSEFISPPWMRIFIRDIYDPFCYVEKNKLGGINVIDLANVYSCSFIETKDLGKINNNNSFSILGRYDNSDIRGCNLLVD